MYKLKPAQYRGRTSWSAYVLYKLKPEVQYESGEVEARITSREEIYKYDVLSWPKTAAVCIGII